MNSLEPASQDTAPRGAGADLATFAIAALLPMVVGLVLLDAYAMLDITGVVFGVIGLFFAGASWKGAHGALVPDEPRGKQVVQLAAVVAGLGVLLLLLA